MFSVRKIIVGALLLLFTFSVTTSVFAQTVGVGSPPSYYYSISKPFAPSPLKNQTEASTKCADSGDQSMECFVGNLFKPGSIFGAGLSYLGAQIVGVQSEGKNGVSYVLPGAIQGTTQAMSLAYTQPAASTSEYVAYLKEGFERPFGIQPAYAQGLGFSSLSPILALWRIFRNLAYFFFVVVFLVVGFAIMLRSKIGGQAAVTIQQALPKLVVSLILVTFSYAIAGLMIDIMYLTIYILIAIFSGSSAFPGGQVPGVGSLTDIAFRNTLFANIFSMMGNTVGSVASSIGIITSETLESVGVPDLASAGFGGVANILTFLILAIFLLTSMFRIFFQLLQAYVGIFLSVIFAPMILLIGAIPGQNTFSTWIRNLAENLAIFPTIILLMILAMYFSNPTIAGSRTSGSGFSAPQLGSNQGDTGRGNYLALVALGMIGAMPEVVKIAKGALKGQMGVDVGAIGKNISQGWSGQEIVPGLGFTKIGARSLMPDRVANAVPFGVGEATPFRTSGKETGLERLLLGTRAQRQKEVDYQRQARLFGQSPPIRQGGIIGLAYNERGAKKSAEGQVGGGASSDKEL